MELRNIAYDNQTSPSSYPTLPCCAQIFRQMYDRNYVQAADMYLRMAIGNAAWPIGVTMVCVGKGYMLYMRVRTARPA